ncbi:MAG: hypothetical protein WEA29_07805 [Acidimicrobiia bacterium]
MGGAPAPSPPSGFAGTLWSGIAAPLERPPLVIAPPAIPEQTGPPDCVVTSTAHSGAGSLRQCLVGAGSGDAVGFDPALFSRNQPGMIRLQGALPLDSGVTVDGAGGVVLDGGGTAGTSFTFVTDGGTTGVTIRGLQIRGFQMGLFVSGGGGHTIEGNVIGGNVFDLTLAVTSGNRVAGNYVGLDATGTKLAYDPGSPQPLSNTSSGRSSDLSSCTTRRMDVFRPQMGDATRGDSVL